MKARTKAVKRAYSLLTEDEKQKLAKSATVKANSVVYIENKVARAKERQKIIDDITKKNERESIF